MAVTAESLAPFGSYTAGADLTGDEGRIQQIEADGDVVRMTDGTIATAQIPGGVIPAGGGAESGQKVTLVFGGKERALAGGALTRGTHSALACDATGRLVAYTAGDIVIGHWVSDDDRNAVAGDWITVIFGFNASNAATAITGALGATDNSIVRSDGAGGVTVQGTGANATLTDAGGMTLAAASSITAGDLTLGTGNLVLSGGGATVDGLDLDTAMRGALGATDNSIVRSDGAGGVTTQGSAATATIDDTGAATFAQTLTVTAGGLTVSAGALDVSAGNITLSGTVDGQDLLATLGAMRLVTVVEGAEADVAANAFDVVLNVVDLAGGAVSSATRLFIACQTPAAASDITLAEVGAGTLVAVGDAHELATIIVDTDANGDATVRATCAGVGAATFKVEVAPPSGAAYFGICPVSLDLNYA